MKTTEAVFILIIGMCGPLVADVLPAFAPESVRVSRLAEFRREVGGYLDRYEMALDGFEMRIRGELAHGSLQRERALARLDVARTVPDYILRNLASTNSDGVFYAYQASDDLDEFLKYFEEELALWKRFPRERTASDAGNDPLILDLARDFGAVGDGVTDAFPAWERAMSAVAERKGAPTILNIPEGRFLFLDTKGRKPRCNMPIVCVTNLLVRGVSPERTTLVAGIRRKPSMEVAACVNVAVRDVTVTTADSTYCEGKVLAVDVEKSQITIRHNPKTVRPDDPYLNSKVHSWQCCTAYDDEGRILRTQNLSWTYEPSVELGGGVWRLQMNPNSPVPSPVDNVKPGMNLVLPNRDYHVGGVMICDYSAFCSAERVHVRRSYALAFGGAGVYTSFKDCKVEPENGFRYATNADSLMTCGGIYLVNFEASAPGDDCINDYVPSYWVGSVDGRRANPGRIHGRSGNGRLRTFYSRSTGQYQSLNRVVSGSKAWADVYEDEFPSDVVPRKTLTCDVKAFGVGSVIRNCHFRNVRSGCHIQMPHVIMEDCSIENSVHGGGVRVGCYALQGNAPYNVTVRRVRVKGAFSGFCTERKGASRTMCAAPIHGITFEDCDVSDVVFGLRLMHASDVLLKNLRFSGPTLKRNAFGERTNDFLVDHCNGVRFENVTLNGEPIALSENENKK